MAENTGGKEDRIVVIDLGGQYCHLIARRVRELGVYSEIAEPSINSSDIDASVKGIILSGGPSSVYSPGAPQIDRRIFSLNIPILGICYGHHLIAEALGGEVSRAEKQEYGKAMLTVKGRSPLFEGTPDEQQVWMSHGDSVSRLPEGFELAASTKDCAIAAMQNNNIFGVQFHPEVVHTTYGKTIISNFLRITGARKQWSVERQLRDIKREIVEKADDKRVFMLVSGGVDSTVAFKLLIDTLGKERVFGLHINNGLMRKDESRQVAEYFRGQGYSNFNVVDAGDDFLSALRGINNPEEKRRVIGEMFLRVQRRSMEKMGLNSEEWLLGQGTIYPDTIETKGSKNADLIKTHHNRIPLVQELIKRGRVIEPIKSLYKDEVRALGRLIGVPERIIRKHPFPGPGLGVRYLCSSGETDLDEELKRKLSGRISSLAIVKENGYSVEVLPVRSVGVQGDSRTYKHPVLLRGVIDFALLGEVSTAITNSVKETNRVVVLLGSRCEGQIRLVKRGITKEGIALLREADSIVSSSLSEGDYNRIWQFPVVMLPLKCSGEEGGGSIVLRPVISREAMTANFAILERKLLDEITEKLLNLRGVDAVFYDVTNKPPGTIEWE